jgi:hypothetical protein
MPGHNIIAFPPPAKARRDYTRVWRKIFALEEILRRYPVIMRCRILVGACALDELPSLAKLVADAAEAKAQVYAVEQEEL